MLAHRLGLIPIAADPRLFEWKRDDESSNERNCIVFKLDVECIKLKRDLNHSSGATGVITRLTECIVLSADLKWLPDGSEMPDETNCRFTASQSTSLLQNGAPVEIKTVHDDILLTKLQTRQVKESTCYVTRICVWQVIQLEAHCFKGVGKDHAKWSPVATAWYRLRPEVVLLKVNIHKGMTSLTRITYAIQEISGKKAQFLAEQFKGLFITETKEGTDTEIAKVSETRGNEVYLEQVPFKYRHPQISQSRSVDCLGSQIGKRKSNCANRRITFSTRSNLSGSTLQKTSSPRPWMSSFTNVTNSLPLFKFNDATFVITCAYVQLSIILWSRLKLIEMASGVFSTKANARLAPSSRSVAPKGVSRQLLVEGSDPRLTAVLCEHSQLQGREDGADL